MLEFMRRESRPQGRLGESRQLSFVESLETRTLMAADLPTVDRVEADNRGQIVVQFNGNIDGDTINKTSVRVYTAGEDNKLGTDDDVLASRSLKFSAKNDKLTINADVKDNQKYRVLLRSKLILSTEGKKLDGEFNGASTDSGNGTAGGAFEFRANKSKSVVAIFNTVMGIIRVRLFKNAAPITVANFLKHANAERWDNTFFHRSAVNFVIQGGGFKVNSNNQVVDVKKDDPIENEPGISNKRGTIAMARIDDNNPNTTDDIDSATNQWFFNLKDSNDFLDDVNGGFTVFGEVTSEKGLAVMDKIANLPVNNEFASPFGELPVVDESKEDATVISPKDDLVLVRRVSIQMDINEV